MADATERTSKMAWARPEVETVRQGVHRIPLPLPMDALTAVNIYVIETEAGLLLIDGGWDVPEGRAQLDASLAEIGFSVGDIAQILVTHIHRDHYTLASALQHEVGCKVWLGEGERNTLETIQSDPSGKDMGFGMLTQAGAEHLIEPWHEWTTGSRHGEHSWDHPSDWFAAETIVELGDVSLRAIPTPGHTHGHYVFIDEQEHLLFSGDHILPTITPSIGFEAVRREQPLATFLSSLQHIADLGELFLMPSHGPVGMNSAERALALIDHHDVRLREMHAQVGEASTAFEVANSLTWTRRQHRLGDLEPYNQALAIIETEYHLELLQARGALTSELSDGVRLYSRA